MTAEKELKVKCPWALVLAWLPSQQEKVIQSLQADGQYNAAHVLEDA
jgi:hypothetical protein